MLNVEEITPPRRRRLWVRLLPVFILAVGGVGYALVVSVLKVRDTAGRLTSL